MLHLKVLMLFVLTAFPALGNEAFYKLDLTTITGQHKTMQTYKSTVLLIVNVASQCGYTDLNYKELVRLQSDYEGKGFSVLAFPSNQFGEQEPEPDDKIHDFAARYHVNFPLFSKSDVIGDNANDIYKYLYEQTYTSPTWNFCKYLVDKNGAVLQMFSEKDSFDKVRESVRYLLTERNEL